MVRHLTHQYILTTRYTIFAVPFPCMFFFPTGTMEIVYIYTHTQTETVEWTDPLGIFILGTKTNDSFRQFMDKYTIDRFLFFCKRVKYFSLNLTVIKKKKRYRKKLYIEFLKSQSKRIDSLAMNSKHFQFCTKKKVWQLKWQAPDF